MKNFKKVTAAIAATLMAATMVAPMAMNFSASAATSVGATSEATSDKGVHRYEAYQIFSATGLDENGILTGIDWGSGVDTESAVEEVTLINAIKAITEIVKGEDGAADTTKTPFADVTTAKDVADVLGQYTDKDNEVVKQFADVVANYLTTIKTSEIDGKLTILNIGYYLIQDANGSPASNNGANSGAKTRYILNIVDENEDVTVTPKSAAPTVDKEVLDETTEGTPISITNGVAANGTWGEEADHAINETFQFKLTANIPATEEMDSYDKYHVTFEDSMSAGVTFEEIASVKVYTDVTDTKGVAVSAYSATNKNGYFATTPDDNNSWKLTIADIKGYLAENGKLSNGVRVEVIYNAHLNENAIRHAESNGDNGQNYVNDSIVNINYNDVLLKYSNNPNFDFGGDTDTDSEKPEDEDEEGETPKDTVGVFTYDVDNTKVDDKNVPLNGAKFNLYAGDIIDGSTPIFLIYDAKLGAYRMPKSGETGSAVIESQGTIVEGAEAKATGKFNFVGLDAGTYTLRETEAPSGYNLAADVKITISATHTENADAAGAKLDLTGSSNMNNTIIDQKGTSLPSTGGMGTTLFYLGGGAMVAVAGIFLITKKRMNKDEA